MSRKSSSLNTFAAAACGTGTDLTNAGADRIEQILNEAHISMSFQCDSEADSVLSYSAEDDEETTHGARVAFKQQPDVEREQVPEPARPSSAGPPTVVWMRAVRSAPSPGADDVLAMTHSSTEPERRKGIIGGIAAMGQRFALAYRRSSRVSPSPPAAEDAGRLGGEGRGPSKAGPRLRLGSRRQPEAGPPLSGLTRRPH